MPRPLHIARAAVCVLGAVLMACISLGCSPATRGPMDTGTLRIGNGGEPKSLDPHIVTGVIEERVLSALFEGLVNVDLETMQPIPGVAETWEVSDDGTEYTFHLRDDARWSNGDPVTAQDFVYSWQRILSPGLAAEYAYMLYPIRGAEAFNRGEIGDFSEVGVVATDEHTLRVTLRAPTPYFFTLQIHFTAYPVRQATIEAYGGMLERDTPWTRAGNMVSNGPFMLASWSPNKEITVVRNPYYWDRANVRLEKVVYRPIQQPSVEERAFRAGELDLTANVPLTKIPAYQRDHADLIRIDAYMATEFIRFNTTRSPFDDRRVRAAFALAIDRETIVKNVLKGGQIPARAFVPPNTAGYTYGHHATTSSRRGARAANDAAISLTRGLGAASADTPARFDPAEARRLLAEAGYAGGRGFPIATLIYDTNNNVRIYCEALQNMWKQELGIDVALQNFDGKTWLANMIALDYDLARSFWVADYPDPSNFLEMFLSTTGNNRTGFNNPEYEALLREAAATQDPAARNRIYQRAEAILLDAVPIAPIYHQTRVFLKSARLHGLTPNTLGRIDFRKLYLER